MDASRTEPCRIDAPITGGRRDARGERATGSRDRALQLGAHGQLHA